MSLVITGTFAIGWTAQLVQSLEQAFRVVGEPTLDNPFALLLARAKAMREHGDEVIIVATKQDVVPKHPQVEALLADLAKAILPAGSDNAKIIIIDADPDEFFAKGIADGFQGSMHALTNMHACPAYLSGTVVKHVRSPPFVADTPELLRDFMMGPDF
jgi:hypothetical protein